METKYNINQSELCNWLYKADHHYLAARLLYLHGLLFSAEENAGFAMELLLKCACKSQGIDFKGKKHKLKDLWLLAKPPFKLDNDWENYISKLQSALYNRHPDTAKWEFGRKADDRYDALDYIYLKLRKWLLPLISKEQRIKTEFEIAIQGESFFKNVFHRHGAWDLPTILKRSNAQIDLI